MAARAKVNNQIYQTLGDRWYHAQDDPVALLRAEADFRNPRIQDVIRLHLGPEPRRILDVGCGGGFLSNYLARCGHAVTGLDIASDSLEVARRHDSTGTVRYMLGEAEALPFAAASLDVVCAMDLLEHVEAPARVVGEAARVLRPDGLFICYTFNRTPLAWLFAVKGVEWFVRNTPPRLHLYRLLIKPRELQRYCGQSGLEVLSRVGVRPRLASPAFWRLLWTRVVPRDFAFTWTRSLQIGYLAVAVRRSG